MKAEDNILVFAILTIASGLVTGRVSKTNTFQAEFVELAVTTDPEFMTVSHNLDNRTSIDMNVTIHQPIEKGNTPFTLLIRIHSGAGNFYQSLVNIKEDFCDYTSTLGKDPLMKIAVANFRRLTNFLGCPVKAAEYQLRKFTANNLIPVGIVPDGEYLINASFKHTNLADGTANFSMVVNIIN